MPQSEAFPPRAGKKTRVILRKGQQPAGQKLPPVLPIVLYNGQPRWSAATDIAQLIEPPPGKLRDYTPQLRYLLLDEGAIDDSGPLALKNLIADCSGSRKAATAAT